MNPKRTTLLLLTAFLLFIALTVLVVTEHTLVQNFNHDFYSPLRGLITPALTTVATWIGSLTHWYAYAPVILLLLFLPRTRVNVGIPLALTLSASALLGPIILKNIFDIERPDINQLIEPGGFGYPSGHAMNAAVFFGMCTILMLRYVGNKPLKIAFTAFAILAALAVGLSRIYLGVHTATDVIGGYLAGSTVICAAILIENRLKTHREADRQPK